MFNLIHAADLHIGAGRHIFGDDYLTRAKTMLWEIKRVALENKVKIIVLAGDIFDKGRPSQPEKDLFIKWLRQIDDEKIYTIIVSGNHESEAANENALDTLSYLENKFNFLRVVIYETKNIELKELDITFCCVPWNFNIVTSSKKLAKKVTTSKFVVVGHLPLPGITTDTGFFIEGSNKMLKDTNFIFWLGDIHKRFISPCGRLQMPGSVVQNNWGDLPPKGVSLISSKNLKKPELITLNVPELLVVKSVEEAQKNSDKIIKLVSNEIVDELPSNIVDHANYFTEEEIISYENEFKATEGLPEFLANKGLNKKEQKLALKYVEKLLK